MSMRVTIAEIKTWKIQGHDSHWIYRSELQQGDAHMYIHSYFRRSACVHLGLTLNAHRTFIFSHKKVCNVLSPKDGIRYLWVNILLHSSR